VISSGAAVQGSPLSGGYAGAKATQRFISAYAQEEARRAGLDITFTAVLPRITPLTDLGRPAVQAYAARAGVPGALRRPGQPGDRRWRGTRAGAVRRARRRARLPAHRHGTPDPPVS
jgi:NAD(P)-dependent dehydrogenase (short-subunit alcohol dehydrogenase family)